MKKGFTKVLIVILCIALIAGAIFLFSFLSKNAQNQPSDTPQAPSIPSPEAPIQNDPTIPEKDTSDDSGSSQQSENAETYIGTGIYHGRIDTSFIEVTIDSVQPLLTSCKLTPELAQNFSSLGLTEESIISFEYQMIDGQYVISKIN